MQWKLKMHRGQMAHRPELPRFITMDMLRNKKSNWTNPLLKEKINVFMYYVKLKGKKSLFNSLLFRAPH